MTSAMLRAELVQVGDKLVLHNARRREPRVVRITRAVTTDDGVTRLWYAGGESTPVRVPADQKVEVIP